MPANVSKMMYVGEKPWHGMGKQLEKEVTSAEAIKAAGLDWQVTKERMVVEVGKTRTQVPNKFAVVRSDNQAVLGVVGKSYHPLQNKDAFKFFDAIVGEKAAMYHTAGVLGAGERVWMLAKLPKDIVVKNVDKVEKYLLLMNAHDGTSMVTTLLTPIRVVCQNTLTAALKGADVQAKLKHTRWLGMRVDTVRETLGLVIKSFDLIGEGAERMASKSVTLPGFMKYLDKLGLRHLAEGQDEPNKASKQLKVVEDLVGRFEHGKGNDQKQIKHTWWTAYNAVTEFVDHSRLFGKAKSPSDRARSILYGAGSFIKQDAWTTALELAKK